MLHNLIKHKCKNIINYANQNNIEIDMTYDDFLNGYFEINYSNILDYENVYYDILVPETEPFSSGKSDYYYNTGVSCPNEANYSKYNLVDVVQKGDIIYESKDGSGVTGHAAIVEGIYYNSKQERYYIRIIEAIRDGVCRSILDDTRVDEKNVSIYRVSEATSSDKATAINFCAGELGSSYNCDFAKDTSSSETDWYCSELVWAGYKAAGFDIETTGNINEPGVSPRDITVHGNGVSKVSFSTK